MDQLMWLVTFIALSLAVGMSAVAMKLLRGDRQRSAARVTALETAALSLDDGNDLVEPEFEPIAPALPVRRAVRVERAPHAERVQPIHYATHAEPVDAVRYVEPALERDFDDFRAAESPMFAATDGPKAPSRRWMAFAAVVVVMSFIIGGAYTLLKPAQLGASPASSLASAAEPASKMASTPGTPGTTTGSVIQGPPIELLSLKHTDDGSTFSVAGLVQNPLNGAPLAHVIAVVYLFDNDGSYFATGRADLEFKGLRPGEESPFTVKIPDTARVGRYRIGFRRDDGSVIAHVDKRGQASAALMTEGKH